MKRRLGLILAVAAVVVIAIGVWWATRGPKEQAAKSRILVVLPTADNPFWIDMRLGAEQAGSALAKDAQVTIRTGNADDDARTQIEIMNDFLAQNAVDALVLGPGSSKAVVPTVAEFNKRKIPVIVVDSQLDESELQRHGAHVDTFIGSNNQHGGQLAAEELRRRIGDKAADVLLVEGSQGHETAIARATGFMSSKAEAWSVDRKAADWDRAKAQAIMAAALAGKRPAGVFACSDEMALGVVTALERSNLPRDQWPVVIGFDATQEGVKAVTEGSLAATVRQRPAEIAREGVEIALRRLRGEPGLPAKKLLPVELVKQ